jgi:hypothetical protein
VEIRGSGGAGGPGAVASPTGCVSAPKNSGLTLPKNAGVLRSQTRTYFTHGHTLPLKADIALCSRHFAFVPDSDMHHFVGATLRKRSLRPADCLSQGNFWPSETHRDPSGDKPQHELAGVTIIIWQVISKLDAVSSVLCHDAHFRGWSVCRKAVSVNRQPMSLGKVEEHCRIATCGNDPPGRGIRPEPVLFKMLPPRHTLHSILSI